MGNAGRLWGRCAKTIFLHLGGCVQKDCFGSAASHQGFIRLYRRNQMGFTRHNQLGGIAGDSPGMLQRVDPPGSRSAPRRWQVCLPEQAETEQLIAHKKRRLALPPLPASSDASYKKEAACASLLVSYSAPSAAHSRLRVRMDDREAHLFAHGKHGHHTHVVHRRAHVHGCISCECHDRLLLSSLFPTCMIGNIHPSRFPVNHFFIFFAAAGAGPKQDSPEGPIQCSLFPAGIVYLSYIVRHAGPEPNQP